MSKKEEKGGLRFLFFGTMAFLYSHALANVKLPAVFSNGMVLQQQKAVPVWGWAAPGEAVSIRADWRNETVRTKAGASGTWKATLQTPSAGGPYNISVQGQNLVELHDVLIGEVWLCSGQSNMGFTLNSAYRAKEEIAAADFPSIRYFSVQRQYGPKEFDDAPGSVWVKTTPQVAGGFSAVAYFFARKIHREKGVPVGLIFSAWGGTPAEAWTPSSVLKNDAALAVYTRRWAAMFTTVGSDSVAYHAAVNEWEARQKTTDGNQSKKPQEPATLISFNRPWREPSVLFNGMVRPVVPFAIKGVLWYQGESNVAYAGEYVRLFGSMIQGWRSRWNDATLPFYFVEIAPFGYGDMDAAARLREAQQRVAAALPQTAVVTTVDVGNMKDQHPVHKQEVGERLAMIALNKLYGEKAVVFGGPELKKATVRNEKLELEFDQPLATNNGQPPAGFEVGYGVSGDSLLFLPANASLQANKVLVWRDGVSKPVAVRYAWLQVGEANITGQNGLPLPPFGKKAIE